MHKPSIVRDYLIATFIAVAIGTLLLVYLQARRGYMNLYIANKSIAATAAVMLGIVFLIGPLTRHFQKFDFTINYRKEIGIVAGIFAIAHGIISLFFMPSRFPLKGYFSHLDTFIPGLVGVLVLGYLIWISRQTVIARLGGSRWWKLQRWGIRIVVLATAIHVIWMKFPGWKSWIVKGGSSELALSGLPPASLLALLFFSWVVLVRVYEYVAMYPSHHVSIHHSPLEVLPHQSIHQVDSAHTLIQQSPSQRLSASQNFFMPFHHSDGIHLGSKGVKWFMIGSGMLLVVFYVFSFWWGARFQ